MMDEFDRSDRGPGHWPKRDQEVIAARDRLVKALQDVKAARARAEKAESEYLQLKAR